MDPLLAEIIAAVAWFFGGEAVLGILVFLWYIGFGALTAATKKVWVGAVAVLGAWLLGLVGSIFIIVQVVVHGIAAAQLAFG